MQRLTYYSIVAQPMVEREIRQLASTSSQANAAANITGMLFFNGRHFVQTIEGMPDDLAKLFSRIRKDERHTDLTVIAQVKIEQRHFAGWGMRYLGFKKEQPKQVSLPEDVASAFVLLNAR